MKKYHAGDVVINEFYTQGYYDTADVDAGVIDSCAAEAKPGLKRRLKRSLTERKPNSRPRPEIPTLPSGTAVDLSAPTLPNDPNVSFHIPSALATANGDPVIAPGSLTPEEWMVIARNSCMLYGRVMHGNEPEIAQYPVLEWKVTDNTDFFRSEHLSGEVSSELTYTERSASYVTQGFMKVAASGSFPFCSASAEHERRERHASAAQSKQLYLIGIWHFPRARVYLDACTQPSRRFVTAIENALKAEDHAAALGEVFSLYGHVVGCDYDIGGRLFFVHRRTETKSTSEAELHSTTRAAVGIKTAWVSGSASFAMSEDKESKNEAQQIAETTTFTSLGGMQPWRVTRKSGRPRLRTPTCGR